MFRKIEALKRKTPHLSPLHGLAISGGQCNIRSYSRPSNTIQTPQTTNTRISANASWSSPQDRVVRNVFGSDYVHAWTLLEACLQHGNMERAESVLFGLTEISGTSDVTLAVNTYLQRLISMNPGRPYVAIDWLRMLEYRIPRFHSNDATEALMIQNAAANSEQHSDLLSQHVRKLNKNQLRSVLRQVELLDAKTIQKVMDTAGLQPEDVDRVTRDVLSRNPTSEDPNIPHKDSNAQSTTTAPAIKGLQKPIKKEGYEALEPTQSFGLVAIRHVLSGLQMKGQADQAALQQLADMAGLPHTKTRDGEQTQGQSLDFFDIYTHLKTDEERKKFDELLQSINERRQKHIENRGIEAARMRWRQMFEQMVEADKSGQGKIQLKGLETLMWEWNQAMMPHIEFEMARLNILTQYKSKTDIPDNVFKEYFPGMKRKDVWSRFEYAPYLCLAKPENLPAMTMMELLRLNTSSRESNKSAVAMVSVGKNVEREYKLEHKRQSRKSKLQATRKTESSASAGVISPGGAQDPTHIPVSVSTTHSWPVAIRAKIGSFLISIFMQVAKVPVSGTDPVSGKRVRGKAPAFHHSYQYQNGTKIGVLRPHTVVANYLSGERVALQPQQLPMLCKPRPWTSWNNGGYWYSPSTIVRSKECPEQVAYIAAASERGQMQAVFDGLNVLGETAWTVNKPILKVLSQIWNSKQEFLDVPPHVQPQPDLSDIPVPSRDSDPGELRDYRRQCRNRVLENGRLYSQRCDLNYKLDIARALLGERFYMPHNLDFRGRAYPLSPHFNHMGNDVSRSLLIFWEGKKLGPRGLYWLKIHLANLFGVNKASHEERVQFADTHMDDILNSANEPLGPNGGWWKEADSPFQALATCFELKSALEHPEGPENFESHLSVHQDGSCNGLQHYAALGGDFEGAYQVNLQAADRPQDVYSRVCEIVKEKVQNETDPRHIAVAQLVAPILNRKVVKQTVMTHVYGVTYAGAREQVANRLKDIDNFPDEMVFKSAAYIAQKVLDAVRELFTSAHEIQDWLGDNASNISRAVTFDPSLHGADSKFVSSVIWTTPLGLPIVQPYRVPKSKQVQTELQTIHISDPYSFQSVNPRKQKTAFPPNYIHSLDASHMLMSALQCSKDGITFASVHDSYWTHAADIDCMNKNLRECFVTLHSDNLIVKLKDEFQTRYGNHLEVIEIPAKSAPGIAIKTLRDQYSREKYGRALKLEIPDQIDMELKSKPEDPSPLKIMMSMDRSEVDALSAEVSGDKEGHKNLTALYQLQQSKEHSGFGVEKLNEILESEEPSEGPLDDAEEKPKRASRRGAIKVLVPLRIPPIPPRGDFDVHNVLSSPYFFS